MNTDKPFDTEAFIRSCAERQLSRNETRLTLGWSQYQMAKILTVLPDIEWPGRGSSVGAKRAAEARRGVYLPQIEKAREAIRLSAVRTVRGVTGSTAELARHFGVVSYNTVRVRVKDEGMSLEEALTTPPKPSARDGAGRGIMKKCLANS